MGAHSVSFCSHNTADGGPSLQYLKLQLSASMSFSLLDLSPQCDSAEVRAAWFGNDGPALQKIKLVV